MNCFNKGNLSINQFIILESLLTPALKPHPAGMNRFNKGNWSMVQNSMVMAYLSFADFYRPRYFLLENVRNFVSHNKSFTFRLTLRTLLDMGYQVRHLIISISKSITCLLA